MHLAGASSPNGIAPTDGCAVAAVQNGKVLLGRGHGMSNLEHGIPITTKSVFGVASVTRQFTGMAIVLGLDPTFVVTFLGPLALLLVAVGLSSTLFGRPASHRERCSIVVRGG
jgi:hypothetical protein